MKKDETQVPAHEKASEDVLCEYSGWFPVVEKKTGAKPNAL
jgi:hypothetical protein